MRILNDAILSATAISGTNTVTSDAVDLTHAAGYSIQLIVTSTATGEAKLQASNDLKDPTNWTDLPDSGTTANITVSGAGSHIWNVSDALYNWVRVSYTNATNSGTLTARSMTKGF